MVEVESGQGDADRVQIVRVKAVPVEIRPLSLQP
jgi:hypothetical protein